MYVKSEDKARIDRFLLMVIAYDRIFYILFLHDIAVRESKRIFRGAAFLQFRGQKIAADGVSR